MTRVFRAANAADDFTHYAGSEAWDDHTMLGIAAGGEMDNFNTDANIDALLAAAGAAAIPEGSSSSLNSAAPATIAMSSVVAAGNLEIIILKGVHQAAHPHISFGYLGRIYHLPVYRDAPNHYTWTGRAITAGQQQLTQSSDGWSNVGAKLRARR